MSGKKCDCDAQMLGALAAGVGLGAICGVVFYAVAYPVLALKDWAGWVQAAGVIVAVLVAIWVPHKDRKSVIQRERERKAAETYEMVRSVFLLSAQASRAMRSSTEKIKKSEKPIRVDRLVNVQKSFSVILGKDIPAEAINLILEIQCEISYQISAIKLNNAGHNNLSVKVERAYARKKKVKTASHKLYELMQLLDRNRGSADAGAGG